MHFYWWIVFLLNLLFGAGIMLTYISRGRKEENHSQSESTVRSNASVLVILPVKGVDYQLDKNLISLRDQEFDSFDLVAVVDSEEDLSVPLLKEGKINYITSMATCEKCSGKVRAIYSALLKYPDYDRYVVADSDIRAQNSWLANLLNPLSDPKIGVSTTFPIFNPEGGFWSKIKMYWGLVGQSMMESSLTKFVWGGSMAFRRELLDSESLRLFSASVSDDIAILRIARKKGLEISYVPESRPKIYSKEDFHEFVEWSNRQTAFSISSTNRTFYFGMVYYVVSIYLLLSSISLAVFVNVIFVVFLFPYFFNSFNSERKVPVKVWYFLALTFVLPFIYVWNLISGMTRKNVVWRGNSYNLYDQQS
jgi:hypothetical protein